MEGGLPKRWIRTSIGDVTSKPQYGYTTKASNSGRVKFLRTTDITSGKIDWSSVPFCKETPADDGKYDLEDGDVVISRAGSVGFSFLVKNPPQAVFASYLIRFKPLINEDYFHFFLKGPYYWREISESKIGIAVGNVNANKLRQIPFPLPPLNEQRRIVEKIEALFSEVDAGVESLKQARAQLGVYRQALLKKAFTGELTAQWRKDNPGLIEPAEQLLERIRHEREARYQQQLTDWKIALKNWEAGGKKGKKPAKPRQPTHIDSIEENSIPDGWLAFPYGELCSIVRNGLSAKPSGSDGYKIARISAVRPMFFDYEDYRHLDCEKDVAESYMLKTGDLIFTRYNGSRRYVGVCAHYIEKDVRLFPDKLIQTRPDLPSLDAQYLELALNSGCSRDFIETKIRTTAGQSGVSGGDVKLTPVAVCSLPEQQEIVRILEAQFEAIEQNEREIDAALHRAEALRQSILKKAFSGQLVPQDPKDEPASALLERIRTERETAAAKKPNKKAARKRARKKANVS